MTRAERIGAFVEHVWKWYAVHRRALPWRDVKIKNEAQRAYRVLVSEVMLQQTQVSRVEITFPRFLKRFPTVHVLAQASNRDVILAWRGMGYNRRALMLRDAARAVVRRSGMRPSIALRIGKCANAKIRKCKNGEIRKYNIVFPVEMEELMELPGVGHYTAAAIRNFAFNIPTPCLETNIRKVLHMTFVGPPNADGTWRKSDAHLLRLAEEVLGAALAQPKTYTLTPNTSDWHHALMDYGSLVVGKKKSTRSTKSTRNTRREPGRYVGSTYVPNRIFRGRIVEALRDVPGGLGLNDIGRRTCLDWDSRKHRAWLRRVLKTLERDELVEKKEGTYLLRA